MKSKFNNSKVPQAHRSTSDVTHTSSYTPRWGMPVPLLTRPLNRRRALRGLLGGAAVAIGLPLLEAHQHRARAQDSGFPQRLGIFYWGNGNLHKTLDRLASNRLHEREDLRELIVDPLFTIGRGQVGSEAPLRIMGAASVHTP